MNSQSVSRHSNDTVLKIGFYIDEEILVNSKAHEVYLYRNVFKLAD